jgi:thiosulfate dehydrogenase
MRASLAALAATSTLACAGDPEVEHLPARERGRQTFTDGSSSVTAAACATCHRLEAEPDRIYPGGDLRGATRRSSFWAGQVGDLLEAVNDCRTLFQGLSALEASSPEAADLYAFLETLEGPPDPLPFTVVQSIADLEPGDAELGLATFAGACRPCHGEMKSGAGRLGQAMPVLPDEALIAHSSYSEQEQRLVFVEKVRHGRFFGYGGFMPPFSLEVLADERLADLLNALGLYSP